MNNKESQKNFWYGVLFLLISPLLTIWASIKNTSVEHRKWLLILAVTIIGSGMVWDDIGDGVVHYQNVYATYSDMEFGTFISSTASILMLETVHGTRGDIYIHTISYFTGSVLGHPPFFWVIVSFVYAFFFISSAFKVYYWYPHRNTTILFIVLFALFVCLKNIEGINTVRTWTGMWAMFFGVISYYQTYKIRYLLCVFLLPPLIHFGYLVIAIPVWIGMLVKTHTSVIKYAAVAVFAVSFFITIDEAIFLEPIQEFEMGEQRTQSYYVEDAGNRQWLDFDRFGDRSIHASYYDIGFTYTFIMLMAWIMIVYGTYFNKFNFIESKLFTMGLGTYVFSNVTTFLFAVSNRSLLIATVFVMAAMVMYIKRSFYSENQFNYLSTGQPAMISALVILLLPFFLFKFMMIIQFVSIYALGFPFFAWFGDETNMTIREALGHLLM